MLKLLPLSHQDTRGHPTPGGIFHGLFFPSLLLLTGIRA